MKNNGKFLKFLGILGGALLLGIGIKKALDYYRGIEQIDKDTKEKLDSLGISQEELEEIDPYDANEFIKSLFIGVSKNPNFDIDTVTVDYDTFWKNSIHVLSTSTTGRNIMKRFIMYFSVPDFTDKKKDLPGIGIFIRSFNDILEQLQERIIRNRNIWAKKELVGIVSYYVPDKERNLTLLKIAELDPKIYESFRENEGNNGLSNFYRTYKDNKVSGDTESKKWINETNTAILNSLYYDENEDADKAEVEDISLAYRVSYNIDSMNCSGITWDMALGCLKFLVDNLEISHRSYIDREDSDPLYYNHLVFHCLDEDEDPDLSRFYEIDDFGKIKEIGYELK